MALNIKTAYFSMSRSEFKKFFDSHIWNYIGKLKMIEWNRFGTETVKMNEIFSPAVSILSLTVWPCSSVQLTVTFCKTDTPEIHDPLDFLDFWHTCLS